MTRPLWLVLRGLLVAGIVLVAFPAWGQERTPPGRSPWSFETTPYLWLTSLHGDLSVRGRDATVDLSAKDIIEELDFGVMLFSELRYDRWGFLLDFFYSRSSPTAETPGTLFSRIDTVSELAMVGPSLAYRAVWLERFTLDVLAGVRIWFADTELDFRPGTAPRVKVDQSKTWADPIIGLRAGYQFADQWSLTALADVGGFGAGSDLTWQGLLGVTYRFGQHWSVTAGYRALGLDFSRDGFELDIIQHGPIVGIGFRF
jgi:opacity protein-like surface antigen